MRAPAQAPTGLGGLGQRNRRGIPQYRSVVPPGRWNRRPPRQGCRPAGRPRLRGWGRRTVSPRPAYEAKGSCRAMAASCHLIATSPRVPLPRLPIPSLSCALPQPKRGSINSFAKPPRRAVQRCMGQWGVGRSRPRSQPIEGESGRGSGIGPPELAPLRPPSLVLPWQRNSRKASDCGTPRPREGLGPLQRGRTPCRQPSGPPAVDRTTSQGSNGSLWRSPWRRRCGPWDRTGQHSGSTRMRPTPHPQSRGS